MPSSAKAEEAVKRGDLDNALAAAKETVREHPQDSNLRVLLFQLLAANGEWERASNQLVVISEMSGRQSTLPLIYNKLLGAELVRAAVFKGLRPPLIFGQPEEWIGQLVQSLAHLVRGEKEAAAKLASAALDAAPANPGTLNGHTFEWLADADSRLGPILEAFIDDNYYWIPMTRIASVLTEPPTDLRHLLWLPASFTWTNGGSVHGFIPVRYPNAETWRDGTLKLARKTDWEEIVPGFFTGKGQRMLSSDSGDHSLLEMRSLDFKTT